MSKHSRIWDNKEDHKVADFLCDKIQPGSSFSIVSAYATINAFDRLRASLTDIDNNQHGSVSTLLFTSSQIILMDHRGYINSFSNGA